MPYCKFCGEILHETVKIFRKKEKREFSCPVHGSQHPIYFNKLGGRRDGHNPHNSGCRDWGTTIKS